MSTIRGTPDDHLPRIVASDEIAALEGDHSHRGGLGGDMLFDISAATSGPAESAVTFCPLARAPFRDEVATPSRTSRGPRTTSSAISARTTSFSDP
jgi:hypothetical protein